MSRSQVESATVGLEQQLCTFLVRGLLFGVPVERVQEVLRFQEMTPVPLAPPVVRGLINLRGQIVTALDMRRLLAGDVELPDATTEAAEPMNVVMRLPDGVVSFLVDEIGDVLQVQDGQREPPPVTLAGRIRDLVTAVYKLENDLLLVLDTHRAAALSIGAEKHES
ncbi:MAG: chemotaxis protein CheW [Planctomycetota bacterium]